MDKRKTACFTGHRIILGEVLPQLTQRLDETIAALVTQGVIFYGVGGAKGFDTLAAQAVLRMRAQYPQVKLIVALPCRNQRAQWQQADKVVCLSESYYNGCMKARNLHLVKNSGVCIAYMEREQSGSGQTVRLARKYGLKIINLAQPPAPTCQSPPNYL